MRRWSSRRLAPAVPVTYTPLPPFPQTTREPATDGPRSALRELVLRHPTRDDGAAMYRFVRDHGGLELNTAYAYIVLAGDQTATSLVAYDDDGTLRGFVLGYRPPTRPDVLFVWQIGVDPATRGLGLGRRMLLRLLDDTRPDGVRYLEATVTPSNGASQKLFRSVARELDVECEDRPHLTSDVFPDDGHEAEDLFRIGPF